MDSKDEAIAFLDAVVPRMRHLGVSQFVFGAQTVTLGEDPAAKSALPAPATVRRMSAVDLAISGPPVTPLYPDAKSGSK